MATDLETAWSGSTGWTNGMGRYLCVPAVSEPIAPAIHRQEAIAVTPTAHVAPPDNPIWSVRERVLNQIGDDFISLRLVYRRLGITPKQRTRCAEVANAVRHYWTKGLLQRRAIRMVGSEAHIFMYRRKT